jgi:hypothetical protein
VGVGGTGLNDWLGCVEKIITKVFDLETIAP